MTVEYKFPAGEPKEALAYFRKKGMRPSFDHREVFREEHAADFTVAKAMQIEVLESIRASVDKALAEGRTFAQFKKELKPRLAEQGWWGIQEVVDPQTGIPITAQLGSPRRLQTIYRTNMRTARAAGQWERIERTQQSHPYLLYELGPSEKHRVEHASWAGLLLPVSDPFWKTHFPPNGWGCKCRVRQVSKAEYSRLSGTGRYGLKAPPIETREWTNKRTGEVTQVAVGIDPGWDYNPGMASRESRALDLFAEKAQATDASVSRAALADIAKSPGFAAWYEKPTGTYPLARVSEEDARLVGARRHIVTLTAETAAKQRKNHTELVPEEYANVQLAVEKGERILDQAGGLIYILEDAGYVAVVKATLTGKALLLTSFRRLSAREAKRDRELQRLRGKARDE